MGIKVIFVEASGKVREFDDAVAGQSLMEVGRSKGVEGILADCGGACACATCHVYVEAEWVAKVGPPDEVESEMLDIVSEYQQDNSRLSCQIRLREDLNGLQVSVAPNGF